MKSICEKYMHFYPNHILLLKVFKIQICTQQGKKRSTDDNEKLHVPKPSTESTLVTPGAQCLINGFGKQSKHKMQC